MGITGSDSTLSGKYLFPQVLFGVGVWVFLIYSDILFGVLELRVWSLLADPPSEVAGYYFFLLHYFCLCFSCLKFGFSVIFPWNISASFLSALHFYMGASGDGFLNALIKSVTTWVDESAEEIPGIVVFSGNNSIVSARNLDLVLKM